MTDAAYQDLVGVLNIAEEPARPAEGPWQLVPALTLDQPGHWPASPSAIPDMPFTAVTDTPSLRIMPSPQQGAVDDLAHGPDGSSAKSTRTTRPSTTTPTTPSSTPANTSH
ncbi:hypothetical protein [Streptomyces sp. NPDC058142]|uniref:hypothetical protein n=1 Tax=Streptomyces sp. NPDC058142 TaxID=3346355 RepID=UPI0036EFB8BF